MNPVDQALRKQCALPSIRPLDEAASYNPPQIMRESYDANHLTQHSDDS
jgi:hypothetical protein